MVTLNEHLKSFIAIWGEDHVDDLLDRGYEPILVTDGTVVKLSWRLMVVDREEDSNLQFK
jgi:hypothetical protein